MNSFTLLATDGCARAGSFSTAHGTFETPAFMPVGTQGTVKGVKPADLHELGAQIVLSNTYHLHLRPGDELIRDLGGLHRFMGWNRPILTDSGGFQVFSLASMRKLTDDGVEFRSHHDGSAVYFTPERVIEIQENLGVDIMMVLDECLPYPCGFADAERSLARTVEWARRSQIARRRPSSQAFGIVQGGMHRELRKRSIEQTVELGFDGYALGGLSVGEPTAVMYEQVEYAAPLMPQESIRYLMGVGTPRDLVECVARGIDLFDCVIPTRSARFGRLYVSSGYMNIRNAAYRRDPEPIDSQCDCAACRTFSRAYISHLIHAKEVLGLELATIHNLRFYQRLMGDIRSSIRNGSFSSFARDFLAEHHYDGTEEGELKRGAD